MKRWNLTFGLLLLLTFILSGQYLRHVFTPEHLDQLVQRAQIRFNHIYLLFSALLNLLVSNIPSEHENKGRKCADHLARLLLILAGFLLVAGFWYEHDGDLSNRQYTRYGLFGTLGAVGLLLVNSWLPQKANRQED